MNDNIAITVYGTRWCYDSRRARRILDQHNISYQYIDIDNDPVGREFVEKTNHGFRSVPTIIFSDGTILVEPSDQELITKLGLGE